MNYIIISNKVITRKHNRMKCSVHLYAYQNNLVYVMNVNINFKLTLPTFSARLRGAKGAISPDGNFLEAAIF